MSTRTITVPRGLYLRLRRLAFDMDVPMIQLIKEGIEWRVSTTTVGAEDRENGVSQGTQLP